MKKFLLPLFFILNLFGISSANAQPEELLPVNEAFQLQIKAVDAQHLRFQWQMAEGYFLYRDKFRVITETAGIRLGEIDFPPAQTITDDLLGKLEVYRDSLSFTLPIDENRYQNNSLDITVTAQGCPPHAQPACYPAYRQTLTVGLPPPQLMTLAAPQTNQAVAQKTRFDEVQLTNSPSLEEMLKNRQGQQAQFLEPDEAFQLTTEVKDQWLIANWQVAENYYLYRQKFKFEAVEDGQLGEPQFPAGKMKQDPTYGETEVYYTEVDIKVPLFDSGHSTVMPVKITYQGCAEAGLCYPPTEKIVELELNQPIVAKNSQTLQQTSSPPPQSAQDRFTALLSDGSIWYTLLIFLGFGLLLALTPCVFPMIPILSSLIVGQGTKVTMTRAFLMSLIYVLGMAITYTLFGVIAGLIGENLQLFLQNPWVLIAFALVFGLLALSMFGFYELQLPAGLQAKLTTFSNRQQGGSFIGAAIMGSLSALIVSPCVAAPLAGALLYISHTGDALLGGLALFALSLGMGLPLLVIGTSAGYLLPKAGSWMESIKAVFGVLLLGVAIWMLGGVAFIPSQVIWLLWAALFIISALFMGALDSLTPETNWRVRLNKGLGILLMIYGILLLVGAASGGKNMLQPLQGLQGSGSAQTINGTEQTLFTYIKGVDGLNQALQQTNGQYVMLDFYADWCVACKEMEHLTFSDPQVRQLLQQMVTLKTDVTANDAEDRALYKKFNVFGPPAILFFSPQGEELASYRIIGFMGAAEFRTHLQAVLDKG